MDDFFSLRLNILSSDGALPIVTPESPGHVAAHCSFSSVLTRLHHRTSLGFATRTCLDYAHVLLTHFNTAPELLTDPRTQYTTHHKTAVTLLLVTRTLYIPRGASIFCSWTKCVFRMTYFFYISN